MAEERSDEKLKEELFKQIGQLRVENEWLKKNLHSSLGKSSRKIMVEKSNKSFTITMQCELAGINKSSLYSEGRKETPENVALMEKIDVIHTSQPCYGARRIMRVLQRNGRVYNIKRIRRLMQRMLILTNYPKCNLSKVAPRHKKYQYLLRDFKIERTNQVYSSPTNGVHYSRFSQLLF